MNKKIYEKPMVEELLLPQGLSLLVNLSLDGNVEDFEGNEETDF